MKVLVTLLSVGFAGTERHAIELANALARHCDVALLLRRRPREAHRQAQYDALRHAIAPGIRIFQASRAAPVIGLWNALLRFRPDVIHAHHERSARIASRYALNVPVIATVHVHFRARDFMRCDGVICLTEAEAQAIPPSYPGERFVIGNWVDPHPPPSDATRCRLRAELGLAADDYVVGSVGRLQPVKGIDGLIAAFAGASLPRSRLVIVGEGPDRADLERMAQALHVGDRVVFAGFRSDVRDLYALFDVFVLNSADEPYGLVILEAASAGVPVITTRTFGASAIAETLPLTLVPVGAEAELVSALREAWANRGRAASGVLAGFAIEDRLRDLLAAYARCIRHSNADRPIASAARSLDPANQE
jgi:glycosyltransferase involved in cell wall biosynthesis